MANPVATALINGKHVEVYTYDQLGAGLPITLAGSSTVGDGSSITTWEWSIVTSDPDLEGGIPEASTVDVGTNGDFTNGKASVQNPTITLDAKGGYCFSLRAQNDIGQWSIPADDNDGGYQAIVYVLTENGTKLPPSNQKRYHDDLNQGLARLETLAVVPVRADGVTKLDKPQAFNFIGADVQNTGGVADISLPAAVTAKGATVEVFSQVPGGTYTVTDTVAFQPYDASFKQTFTAPSAGTYLITANASIYGDSATTGGRHRFVFDKGEANEQIIGDDDDRWSIHAASGFHEQRGYVFSVELTAGTHTFEPQVKRIAAFGAGSPTVNANSSWLVQGTLVSGSGAGGEIITKTLMETASDPIDNDDPTWEAIKVSAVEALQITVEVSEGEELVIEAGGMWWPSTAALTHATFSLWNDTDAVKIGPDQTLSSETNSSSGDVFRNLSIKRFTGPLAAGTYLFTLKAYRPSFGTKRNSILENGYILCRQMRGGLVPVRQDGMTILDKPAAFDFVNAQVTNVGGVAKVDLLGAQGIDSDAATVEHYTAYSVTVINTWEDIGISKVITGNIGEWVLLIWNGDVDHTSDHETYVRFAVDGSDVQGIQSGGAQPSFGASHRFSWSMVLPFQMTATSHTVTVEMYSSSTSVVMRDFAAGFGIQVIKWRGGYVQPDNIPVFERDSSDTSLVRANAAIGASSEMRFALSDGQIRAATMPLTCDIDVDGIGGRDTGDGSAEAAGDLYHLYAVESDADVSKIKLVLSKDAVPGTSGPPSFSIYRYLWTVRIDTIGPVVIEEFEMSEDGWYAPSVKNDLDYAIEAVTSSTPSAASSWIDKSAAMQTLVPASADAVRVRGYLDSGSNVTMGIAPQASPPWTPAIAQPFGQAFLYTQTSQGPTLNTVELAIPARELAIYYTANVTLWTSVSVEAYRNALYPGASGGTQVQANVTEDTKSPKGTWQSGTTVDFAARPGQPSTMRLTLQDGKQRTASGTLAWDHANSVADLGYDEAASEAAGDKWIYFYAVPSSGDDDVLTVRASDNPPSTGPAGYSNWKLVWAAYRLSAALLKVYQRGNVFDYANNRQSLDFTGSGAADGVIQTLSLAADIPASAILARIQAYSQMNAATGSMYVFSDGDEDLSTGTTRHNTAQLKIAAPNTNSIGHWNEGQIPVPGGTKQIGYFREAAYLNSRIETLGWTDEWIDP